MRIYPKALWLGLLLTSFARAADSPASSSSSSSKDDSELGLRWGVPISAPFSLPGGDFQNKDLAPGQELFANFGGSAEQGSIEGWRFGAFVMATGSWARPIYGLDADYAFKWNTVKLRLGFGFLNSQDLQKTAYNGSPFDIYVFSYLVELGVDVAPRTYAALALRSLSLGSSDIPSIEDNGASLAHESTSVTALKIESAFLEPLLLSAFYEWYSLGAAVVGSKDFVMKIDDNETVHRTMIGAGVKLGSAELWARYYRVFGVDDKVALPYQLPVLHNDYILASDFAVAEAKWIF